MYDSDKRKLLSALCHGSIFFSVAVMSFAIPLAILFLSDDPVVRANAKESLNFHINLYIYAGIFILLCLVLIGFPLLVGLIVASWVLPIIAIVKILANPDEPYRYPFLFRLV